MRRATKIKITRARGLARKAAVAMAAPARRAFPPWIDAGERGVALAATGVTPRVRDGLVLRMVGQKSKTAVARNSSDGPGAR